MPDSDSPETSPTRRDPEARRRAIVDAAAELILEVGTDSVTHRLVAARAGVPLGSTTQYFKTLDDLKAAALETLSDRIDLDLREMDEAVTETDGSPAVIAKLVRDYLADKEMVRADIALFVAACYHPEVKPLARRWFEGLVEILARHTDRERARAVAVFLDGTGAHALLHEEPLPLDLIESTITAVFEHGRDS